MEYIHHYTSIKNLALILESKKLRFTRFDLLDDMMEEGAFSDEFKWLATWCFVSSWTYDKMESIPLWKMYSSIYDGIRISLPKDMFNHHIIESFAEENHGLNGAPLVSPFTKEETFYNGSFHIINFFEDAKADFYKTVVYDVDVVDYYKNLMLYKDGAYIIENFFEIGKYKEKAWEFQKEVRFILYAKPLLPLDHPNIGGNVMRQYDKDNCNANERNEIKYIDIMLNQEIFKNMIITIAPCASESERIIVKALSEKCEKDIQIMDSQLTGKIRK